MVVTLPLLTFSQYRVWTSYTPATANPQLMWCFGGLPAVGQRISEELLSTNQA